MTFFCPDCFNPQRKDLVEAVAKAEADFKVAMDKIKQTITVEKQVWSIIPNSSMSQEQDYSQTSQRDTLSLELEAASTTDFEPAREDRYQCFQGDIVNSLLRNIEQSIYDYNREIEGAINLFLDESDVVKGTPLKFWDQIDPGHHLVTGKQWFNVDGTANNLSEGHAPITAALRQMLMTPDDKRLQISAELRELTFSQVHTALINWFVFDLLNNELDFYRFGYLKPLRATQKAVLDFGDASMDIAFLLSVCIYLNINSNKV